MTEITKSSIIMPSDDIIIREIEGDLIIIPLENEAGVSDDALFSLDGIGQIIWSKFESKKALGEIIQELQQEYDDPQNTIETDVLSFVEELVTRHIVIVK